MLVFAFAQPLLTKNKIDNVSPRAVEMFIDNSFSMESTKDEVPLLTMAKDNAREVINSYKQSDLFLVLTHDLEAKHQRYVDQKTALSFIEEVVITPKVEILQNAMNVMNRLGNDKTDYLHER